MAFLLESDARADSALVRRVVANAATWYAPDRWCATGRWNGESPTHSESPMPARGGLFYSWHATDLLERVATAGMTFDLEGLRRLRRHLHDEIQSGAWIYYRDSTSGVAETFFSTAAGLASYVRCIRVLEGPRASALIAAKAANAAGWSVPSVTAHALLFLATFRSDRARPSTPPAGPPGAPVVTGRSFADADL